MLKNQRAAWADRGSRHDRGYGSAWIKLRAIIMARDMHLCQPCLAKGRPTPATQVDHITPKARGGTDDPSNLRAICDECHTVKTVSDNGGRRRPRTGLDGWPIE